MSEPRMICLGIVSAPHGVRGEVKIRSFTERPEDVVAYGELYDETGERSFRAQRRGMVRGAVVARFEGVDDRDAAERLRGLRLHVPRDRLPPAEGDEYYHADLIGLRADLLAEDGGTDQPLGTVCAVEDFGAGDRDRRRGQAARDGSVHPRGRAGGGSCPRPGRHRRRSRPARRRRRRARARTAGRRRLDAASLLPCQLMRPRRLFGMPISALALPLAKLAGAPAMRTPLSHCVGEGKPAAVSTSTSLSRTRNAQAGEGRGAGLRSPRGLRLQRRAGARRPGRG